MKTILAFAETTCPKPMPSHSRIARAMRRLPLLMFLALPAKAQAQDYIYSTNNGAINNAAIYSGTLFGFSSVAADLANKLFNVDSSLVGAVSNRPTQLKLPSVNDSAEQRLRAQIDEWSISKLLGEAGGNPVVSYRPGLELRAVIPINVVQSKKYPGIEYSGILVQATRSNPLQLINPFAPAGFGDGQANVVRNLVTREAEGLKLWQISF